MAKYIRKDEYNEIKHLLRYELPDKEVARIKSRELSTIQRIRTTENFAEYQLLQRVNNHKGSNTKLIQMQPKILADTEIDLPKDKVKPEQAIVRIAKALERIADVLENQPTKKGFFK